MTSQTSQSLGIPNNVVTRIKNAGGIMADHDVKFEDRGELRNVVVEFEVRADKVRRGTKKVRRYLFQDRTGHVGTSAKHMRDLLREVYDAGVHAGASNPYC